MGAVTRRKACSVKGRAAQPLYVCTYSWPALHKGTLHGRAYHAQYIAHMYLWSVYVRIRTYGMVALQTVISIIINVIAEGVAKPEPMETDHEEGQETGGKGAGKGLPPPPVIWLPGRWRWGARGARLATRKVRHL